MLSIGFNLIPAPDFNLEPELYYAGNDVIGGVMKLTLSGTHYADNAENYDQMAENILGLNGVCRTLQKKGDCSASIESLVGAVGYVESSTVSETESPLDLNYNIVMVFTHDKNRAIMITPDTNYTGLGTSLILNNFSKSESIEANPVSTFSYSTSGKLTAAIAKYSVECSIGVYSANRCDSGSNADKLTTITSYLQSKTNFTRNFNIPNGMSKFLLNSKKSIAENGGSISKQYIVCPSTSLATVTLNTSNRTDHITGAAKINIQGVITGLRSFNDAETVYSKISNINSSASKDLLKESCGEQTPLPLDLCRILESSKRIDNKAKRSISFDFTYGDVEKCVAQGYQVVTEYTEQKGVNKIAEYLIPGKSKSIIFKSAGKTADKRKLKVSAKFTSCDEGFVSTVKSAVQTQFAKEKNNLGMTGGNFIKISQGEETGRYSFSKTEEYIECK